MQAEEDEDRGYSKKGAPVDCSKMLEDSAQAVLAQDPNVQNLNVGARWYSHLQCHANNEFRLLFLLLFTLNGISIKDCPLKWMVRLSGSSILHQAIDRPK